MTGRTSAVLRAAECVLLDFDGPVCAIFGGYPAVEVARGLRTLLVEIGATLPFDVATTDDPLVVLRHAASLGAGTARRVERAQQDAELRAVDTATPTPGAAQFLDACRLSGRPVAIVSNNSGPAVSAYLARAGLDDRVMHVEGRDPDNVALMKPDPFLLLRALQALGCSAGSGVLVGDSMSDVQAARRAGALVIGYANKPGKRAQLAGADAVVESMRALAAQTVTVDSRR